MKHLLTGLAYCTLAGGLWNHDWHLIVASACVAAIWPLIRTDIERVAHETTLDALWDDGEDK